MIPDPGRESGYFAALERLERTTPIVQLSAVGVPMTTSMRIANGTKNEHPSVLRLIRDNLADFNEFGLVGFEIAPRPAGQHGGGDVTIAILNEEHATLLLTYMRNNDVVKDFKKRLVRAFSELRRAEVQRTPQTREERFALALADAQEMLAEKDERIAELSSSVVELSGPASSWNELAEAAGDYSVADAAKVLSRAPAIDTGERRLFKQMQGLGWIYRRDGHWCAYQAQIDVGRLAEKVGQRYWKPIADQWIVPIPTIRITPKGLQELHKRLGGGSDQLTLAAVTE